MTDRHQATSYPLRMPDELRERLREAAEESGRSTNAEIVARLQASFVERSELTRAEVVAVVKATLDELLKRQGAKKRPAR
jgi:predicted transcriptional regulator